MSFRQAGMICGNVADAENYRAQARAIIVYIVEHTPPDLRAMFMDRHDVRAVFGTT